uniref:Uncharacterized protein n=1 Tax=Phakopsora pachyrhizi TaxID=170000 RepID=A0A0S1MKC1_PHAPC
MNNGSMTFTTQTIRAVLTTTIGHQPLRPLAELQTLMISGPLTSS